MGWMNRTTNGISFTDFLFDASSHTATEVTSDTSLDNSSVVRTIIKEHLLQ
jgi:hypothetical protein